MYRRYRSNYKKQLGEKSCLKQLLIHLHEFSQELHENFFNKISLLNCVSHSLFSQLGHLTHLVVSNSLGCHGLQHSRIFCSSLSPVFCSNLCPLSQQCYLTISSSADPFSSCHQSFQHEGLV